MEIIIVAISGSNLRGLSQVKHFPQCAGLSDCILDIAFKTNCSELWRPKEINNSFQYRILHAHPFLPTLMLTTKITRFQLLTGNYFEMELTHRKWDESVPRIPLPEWRWAAFWSDSFSWGVRAGKESSGFRKDWYNVLMEYFFVVCRDDQILPVKRRLRLLENHDLDP